LSLRSGLIWTAAWSALALIGSYLLNPLIVAVLLTAAGLEVIYCLLQKVSYLRTLVSGLVKSSGPIAAILVVDRNPDLRLLLVFVWLFLWEIGGQNIPSDWNYSIEDLRAQAKTIPIRFGLRTAGLIVMTALGLSVAASAFLPLVSPARLGLLYSAASLLVGYLLLLRPGYELARIRAGELAARLFDHASYYPFSQFLLISAFLLIERFV
jgi:4-hydroxybenzoate polyprenyltransferase